MSNQRPSLKFIEQEVPKERKTKIWHVYNLRAGHLGTIAWVMTGYRYSTVGLVRQYKLIELIDIASFIMTANRNHRMEYSKEAKQIKKLMSVT